MNVRRYVFVKVQLVIWFQSSLSHETLATCTLLHPRKDYTHEERSTSHFTLKKLGGSLECLLQDCLKYTHTCREYMVKGKVHWRNC